MDITRHLTLYGNYIALIFSGPLDLHRSCTPQWSPDHHEPAASDMSHVTCSMTPAENRRLPRQGSCQHGDRWRVQYCPQVMAFSTYRQSETIGVTEAIGCKGRTLTPNYMVQGSRNHHISKEEGSHPREQPPEQSCHTKPRQSLDKLAVRDN